MSLRAFMYVHWNGMVLGLGNTLSDVLYLSCPYFFQKFVPMFLFFSVAFLPSIITQSRLLNSFLFKAVLFFLHFLYKISQCIKMALIFHVNYISIQFGDHTQPSFSFVILQSENFTPQNIVVVCHDTT